MRLLFLSAALLSLNCELSHASPQEVAAFLDKYCIECHDTDVQKGDVDLEPLFDAFEIGDKKSAILWHDVMNQLNLDEMPPRKKEQPSDDEALATIAWISESLDTFYTANKPAEANTVLRRLNRVEYQNTIRDLLGVEFEPGEGFPADGTIEGFDNIGKGLTVSTTLFEKYLEAAEEIAVKAIAIGPKPKRVLHRNQNKDLDCELGIRKGTGFEIASDREARARVFPVKPVPVDGEYRVRIKVKPVRPGKKTLGINLKTGLADRELTVPLKFIEDFQFKTEEEFETTVKIRAGETVHVSFANGGPIPIVSAQRKYKGAAVIIEWIEVDGPIINQWPPRSDRQFLEPGDGEMSLEAATEILTTFAGKAFRRPPTPAMMAPIIETYREERKNRAWFRVAMQSAVQVALCSPHFLYLNIPDGEDATDTLNDFELAVRLSYFLWSSMPDDALYESAKEGKLTTSADHLRSEVDRMLRDPKAEAFYENFVGQWLQTRRVGDMPPDPKMFPQWDRELEVAIREETERFVKHLVDENQSIYNILDSDFTILNERLARHYGIKEVKGENFRKVALPANHKRGGVIGQASFHTVTSNGTNTSPIVRGIYVLENILGTPPQPPPPDIDPIEPDTRGATTVRQQLAKHREVATCFDCHQRIDPLGLALEGFDPIGQTRTHYKLPNPKKPKGPAVETHAETVDGVKLAGATDLKNYLMDRKHLFAHGLTEKLLVYGTGREMSYYDGKVVKELSEPLKNPNEAGFRNLIKEVVASKSFRSR